MITKEQKENIELENKKSIDVLNYKIRSCEKLKLSVTRKHVLSGEGNILGSILFVALSPGAKEDSENRMFIGPSGRFFNKRLQTPGIDRDLREEMSFKNVNGKLLILDGIKIFPLTHPSALLYSPSFEPGTVEKYSKLKSYL